MSISERITRLTIIRDGLEDQLSSGVTEYEIRGRRVEREKVVQYLEYLNREIDKAELVSSRTARGRIRNIVNLPRMNGTLSDPGIKYK